VIGHERSGFEVGGRTLSPFVGRDRELATLNDLLATAEDGRGQVVGILGDPGVGKSRLLHEFRQGLERGRAAYIEGRCLSYGNTIPYLPIIDIVRNSFGVLDTDAPDVITQKVYAIVETLGVEREVTAPYLLHLLGCRSGVEAVQGLSPQAVKVRTMEALRQTAIAASRERPIIFAIEDLQWIDQTGEDALASLADSLAGCPIMLIATYRPGYRPKWLERSYATQIGLNRLTRAHSLAVLHSVIPEDELPPHLAKVILSHAEGVPFFLEELARAVTDHPDLRSDVMVPHTIQGVLVARIDRLPDEERLLLQTASVVGREVAVLVLKTVADLPEEVLRPRLSRLEASEFLHQTRVTPTEEYAFTHALTHEAAYQSVLEDRRRPLHAKVAEALETLSPDVRERRPELLAWHYSHAKLREPAIACWQLAGQSAIQRSASAEAIAHLGKGLDLLNELPDTPTRVPHELALRIALGQAQVMSAGYGSPELEPTLARARELCQQMGSRRISSPCSSACGASTSPAATSPRRRSWRTSCSPPPSDRLTRGSPPRLMSRAACPSSTRASWKRRGGTSSGRSSATVPSTRRLRPWRTGKTSEWLRFASWLGRSPCKAIVIRPLRRPCEDSRRRGPPPTRSLWRWPSI